jgi:hypothetical protein
MMEGKKNIPVNPARKTVSVKVRCNTEPVLISFLGDGKIEPGFSGHLHLGP